MWFLKNFVLQEKKSLQYICPEIAKNGDVSSCRSKDSCRFSHDLEGFKAQVLEDWIGLVWFLNVLIVMLFNYSDDVVLLNVETG